MMQYSARDPDICIGGKFTNASHFAFHIATKKWSTTSLRCKKSSFEIALFDILKQSYNWSWHNWQLCRYGNLLIVLHEFHYHVEKYRLSSYREFFAHIYASPLQVPKVIELWGVLATLFFSDVTAGPMTHICCQVTGRKLPTACFKEKGLSWLGFQPLTFRLWDDSFIIVPPRWWLDDT